ncbi:MAG: DUF4062 domain-containing protein [Williamsia sp.]|nr:DUF4062 domain-containing protein [Williamsia sp.]
MGNDLQFEPRLFAGVTISSTFTDLEEHRTALIKAIKSHGLTDIAMENDSAKLIDVIDSSLQMVRDGSAYIGVISMKYGQVPVSPTRNPNNLSITEIEFKEAFRLARPILLFIMGDGHLILPKDVERDPAKILKLDAFRERAKKMKDDPGVHRVYSTFNSLEDFKVKIGPSIAELRNHLTAVVKPITNTTLLTPMGAPPDPIPVPPILYAQPPYIGSHQFVGRETQLEVLNDWARPANPYTILLFEAIGGNGKSMLTWEWTKYHSTAVRKWAGIFWYSFYDRGAVMADFCRHALSYMTGRPLEDLKKKKTLELKDSLIYYLNSQPWLFILDGLERVLVAYHRIDAAEIADEELNTPTDKIASRNPCSCVNDEDDDLLRSLSAASPSKLLISSRLVPRVFLNAASQPIPGLQRILLTGLRPVDAEKLFRSCGITGNSETIQDYLLTNCDCHPLTIGVLAGLVNNYLPDRGNFDIWATDQEGGGQLDFSSLDLVQKRNHILKAGLYALSDKSRQLLCTIALLSEAVDYYVLSALNPHIPQAPSAVGEPIKPDLQKKGENDPETKKLEEEYKVSCQRWKVYQQKLEEWRNSSEYREAPKKLTSSVHDLEVRGLMQYDNNTKRYDLHPVVRGIAVSELQGKEKEQYGQQVVNYFSSRITNTFENTNSLDGLSYGLHIVKTLFRMGHYQEAYKVFNNGLSRALLLKFEAYKEVLTFVKLFFTGGWNSPCTDLPVHYNSNLANLAAISLRFIGEPSEALSILSLIIPIDIKQLNLLELSTKLINATECLIEENSLASAKRILDLSSSLVAIGFNEEQSFMITFQRFSLLARIGNWAAAWDTLGMIGKEMSYRPIPHFQPGYAEYLYARFRFWKGDIQNEHIALAKQRALKGGNHKIIRDIHCLEGIRLIEQAKWGPAIEKLNEAVRMARSIGQTDAELETWLALTKFQLGLLLDPHDEAEYLSHVKRPAHLPLAKLWLAINKASNAKYHALEAYKWAWADGGRFVNRWALNVTLSLFKQLRIQIPKLPCYNSKDHEKTNWEVGVSKFIEERKRMK